MSRIAQFIGALATLSLVAIAQAQQPTRPQIQTTKVEGTDNV